MRAFLVALSLALQVTSAVPAEAATQSRRPTPLSDQDREYLEGVTCRTLGVGAISIEAIHQYSTNDPRDGTLVTCALHVRKDALEAKAKFLCRQLEKVWTCRGQRLDLTRKVAGTGPYQMMASGMTLDEALAALDCLEHALRDQPELRDVAVNKVRLLSPGEPGKVIIDFDSGYRCRIAEVPVRCSKTAGQPTPVAVSDCDR